MVRRSDLCKVEWLMKISPWMWPVGWACLLAACGGSGGGQHRDAGPSLDGASDGRMVPPDARTVDGPTSDGTVSSSDAADHDARRDDADAAADAATPPDAA